MDPSVAKSGRRTTGLSKRIRQRARLPVVSSYDRVAVIDHANQDYVSGWALHESGVMRVDVYVDGRRVGQAQYGSLRLDVAARFRDVESDREASPDLAHSGFTYLFDPDDLAVSGREFVSVHVVCHAYGGETCASFPIELPTALMPSRYAPDTAPTESVAYPSPFPLAVERALRALRGERADEGGPWTASRVDDAVDDLILAHEVASRDTQKLFSYFSYLREIWTRIEFNARHFPALNRTPTEGGKDRQVVATSPIELFVIAHHLASLRSRGVEGSVCEFGCFKGFSTSVLSAACSRLGMRLEVFDSFAGLPDSDSEFYRAGEFKGARSEVEANVAEFGDPSVVRFHPGFFSETVDLFREPRIACIWMDVDLELSATDAMGVLPRLDPRSCVFSDECAPEDFVAGRISEERSPDRVIAPICDAFREDGRAVTGSFIAGHTGCFRDPKQSLPVLMPQALLRLRDAIS